MEPQDAEVGFWVKDALYTFVPSEKKEGARRLYFVKTKEQDILQKCKEWPSRYFGTYDQNKINISLMKDGIPIHYIWLPKEETPTIGRKLSGFSLVVK